MRPIGVVRSPPKALAKAPRQGVEGARRLDRGDGERASGAGGVGPLEAIDGPPVVDIKPVIKDDTEAETAPPRASPLPAPRPQPLIAVRDVEASSRWYQKLLGCRSDHGGDEYERLVTAARPGGPARLILQLHRWEVDHHHGAIGDEAKPHGNGVLLWFEVDDFDRVVARARALRARIVLPVHRNPPDGEPGGPAHRELWLRDRDGYTVVVASPDGESPLAPARRTPRAR